VHLQRIASKRAHTRQVSEVLLGEASSFIRERLTGHY